MAKEQIETRLKLKKLKSFHDNVLNNKQAREFKEAFGGKTDGAANIELFKMTLHFVEKDANGAVKSEYREKYLQNRQDINDYIAGGEKREEYLKRKVKQIISFEFTEDMLKPEYISAHFTELLEMSRLMNGFYNIARENEEFLDSDAFTEQERAEFYLKFTENTIPATLSQILEAYAGTLGMHSNGEELDMFPVKKTGDAEADKNALKKEHSFRQQKYKTMLDILLQKTLSDDIRSYRKLEEIMKDQPQLKERIADLEKKTKKTAPGEFSSVKELKDYFYGRKDKLSKKAVLLAKSNGLEEYTKESGIRAEKEALEKRIKEIQAETIERDERKVHETDIEDEIREHHDQMDRETAKKAALIDKRISYNQDRILDSDRLYDTLESSGENKIYNLSPVMLGKIKAYTDRLLSLNFNNKTLSEDYITEHIDEFYEYSRAYHLLDLMKEQLPETLHFLNDYEKNKITGRKGYISEVDELLKLVLKKHGMYMTKFEKDDKGDRWSGYVILNSFAGPTEEEKARLEKDIKELSKKLKTLDVENNRKAKENLVRVADDSIFRDEQEAEEAEEAEKLVTNKVAGDGIFREEKDAAKKKFLSDNSPELLKHFEAERRLYNSDDYPEETKKRYEALLKEKKFAVPKDMADLISIRGDHMERKYFYKRNARGEIYEAEDYFWKGDTDPVFKEAYDWLVGYYRANMDHIKEPAPVRYDKQAAAPLKGEHTPYENQGHTLYCWACTMNGLMNEYAGHKVSDLDMVKNTPLNIPSFEESGFTDRAKYDEGVKLANRMHKGNETGNPAIFGDYVFQKLPDTAVCGAHIGIDPKRREFCKRRFLETLGTRLEKGPVGLLYAGHFVLVYAIDGDKLKVRNSQADDPDRLEDYKYDANHIFSSNYREVELAWLENVRGREQEIAREFSLEYNEENRTFSGAVNREKETILHRNGIEGMKAIAEGDLVSYQIYIPKQLGGN